MTTSNELLLKIGSFYDNAFDSILNHAAVLKACKVDKTKYTTDSGWNSDEEGEIKVSRREVIVGNTSFSIMVSDEGSASIMVLSLVTLKLVEAFISGEGIVFLSYDIIRNEAGIKRKHGKKVVPTHEMVKLHNLLKGFDNESSNEQ